MDRRTQKTKAAIQKAYFSILMDNKETHVTVAEIARRANIDRKTFYLHYDSIEDIIREFSEDKIRELMDMLEKDGFLQKPFDVYLLFRDLDELLKRDIDFYEQIINTSASDFIWAQMQDLLVKAIKKVYSGIVGLTPEELEVYARFYASGVLAVYIAWMKGEFGFSIDKLGEVAAKMTNFRAEEIEASSR